MLDERHSGLITLPSSREGPDNENRILDLTEDFLTAYCGKQLKDTLSSVYSHAVRVTLISEQIALASTTPAFIPKEIAQIKRASYLHDYAKRYYDPDLLEKPGRLSDEEFEAIKGHARGGALFLTDACAKYGGTLVNKEVIAMVEFHHAVQPRFYPVDLRESEELPFTPSTRKSRRRGYRQLLVLVIADEIDAAFGDRTYHHPEKLTPAQALEQRQARFTGIRDDFVKLANGPSSYVDLAIQQAYILRNHIQPISAN